MKAVYRFNRNADPQAHLKTFRRPVAMLTLMALAAMTLGQIPFSARADQLPAPQLIKVSGEPIRLVYADGREATLRFSILRGMNYRLPISVVENTCNDRTGVVCDYKIPFTTVTLFFGWSKHSDPSKLNQELVIPSTGDGRKVEYDIALSSAQSSLYPGLADLKSIPDQTVTCPAWDWFDSNDTDHPGGRLVRSISTEFNLPNSETGQDEARFFSTVRGVTLSPLSGNTARVLSASFYPFSTSPAAPILLFGKSAWYIQRTDGETCQVTVNANLQDLAAAVGTLDGARAASLHDSQPYVYGNAERDRAYAIDIGLNNQLPSNLENAQ